jgi:N-acetylglucosaminyldiphosphoundecaprenol N-acetyl-beta-D-mannosaminyltransferase
MDSEVTLIRDIAMSRPVAQIRPPDGRDAPADPRPWRPWIPVARIFDVPIQDVTRDYILEFIDARIALRRRALILNANAHLLNFAFERRWLRDLFNRADLVFCDGFGVALATRLAGFPPPRRLTPPDFIDGMAALCAHRGFSMFLLGGAPGVADRAADRLTIRHPDLKIAGIRHGFFDQAANSAENLAVVEQINRAKPDLLIVCFGMPLQERWIAENWARLDAGIGLTAGALFDYVSGDLRRAPAWMTNHGLEWFSRLFIEPRRLWRRYVIGLPVFFFRVARTASRTPPS